MTAKEVFEYLEGMTLGDKYSHGGTLREMGELVKGKVLYAAAIDGASAGKAKKTIEKNT